MITLQQSLASLPWPTLAWLAVVWLAVNVGFVMGAMWASRESGE